MCSDGFSAQGVTRPESCYQPGWAFIGHLGEESTFKLTQISGRIQFLEAVGPSSLFPCCLSSQGPLTVPRGLLHSFPCGPFLRLQTSNGGWSPFLALTLSAFLFCLLSPPSSFTTRLRKDCTFKSSCDSIGLTLLVTLLKAQLYLIT